MGKQKETFQALGKAEILDDSAFFRTGSFLPDQPSLHWELWGWLCLTQAQAGCACAKSPLLDSVNSSHMSLP